MVLYHLYNAQCMMHNVQCMIYIQGNNLNESVIYTVKDEGASPLFAQKLGRHILAAPSFI